MKELCRIIPAGSCPNCGGSQFVVSEILATNYLTNRDGDIVDYQEQKHDISGICCKCQKIYPMMETANGFIPMTPLRQLLFQTTPHADASKSPKTKQIANPMEKSKNDIKV